MVDYEDPDIPAGHGRAGGPGTYGAYTFAGTGIDVFAVKSAALTVDGKTHKTGKIRISMDGKVIETVELASADKDARYRVASISHLSDGIHVLQVEPVGGWIVVGGATVLGQTETLAIRGSGDGRLMAYFPFDDGRGRVTAEASGHSQMGTLLGAAVWSQDAKIGTGAISFTGSGAVETPMPAVDTSHSFTVAAWVKLATTDGYQTFVSIDGATVSGFYLQLRNDTHRFAFTMLPNDSLGAGSTPVVADWNTPPVSGVWYHLAGVYDAHSNMLGLYVNGRLQSTAPFNTPWAAGGNTAIGRGKFGQPTDFVIGNIDDVRLYAGALAPDEISALYTAP